MLSEEQKKVIEEYVEDKYYDKKKLLKYLEMHTIVGNEVFQYCDRKANMNMHDISPKASGYRKMKACIRMSDVQKLKIIHIHERPGYKREYLLGIADTPFWWGNIYY